MMIRLCVVRCRGASRLAHTTPFRRDGRGRGRTRKRVEAIASGEKRQVCGILGARSVDARRPVVVPGIYGVGRGDDDMRGKVGTGRVEDDVTAIELQRAEMFLRTIINAASDEEEWGVIHSSPGKPATLTSRLRFWLGVLS